jgi:hypothetical protein
VLFLSCQIPAGALPATRLRSTSIPVGPCLSPTSGLHLLILPQSAVRMSAPSRLLQAVKLVAGLQSEGEAFRSFLQLVQVNARYYIQLCRKYVLQYALKLSSYIPLKTDGRLLYLKAQSVPRCKHFSSRL